MALASKDEVYAICKDWARRQQEYQGYANYVTWLIAYEINNDKQLSEMWGADAEEALREASCAGYMGDPCLGSASAQPISLMNITQLDASH